MTLERIHAAITDAVTQIQCQSQRDVPPIRCDTRLIGDVPGFDSLNAVELTILLMDVLSDELQGRSIPDHIVLGERKTARPTVDEIAANIKQHLDSSIEFTKCERAG